MKNTQKLLDDKFREAVRLYPNQIKFFAACGANVDVTNRLGNTSLMLAVFFEEVHTVNTLIECGVNINAQNRNGDTALMMAIRSGNKEIIKILIDAGAKTYVTDKAGNDAFTKFYTTQLNQNSK